MLLQFELSWISLPCSCKKLQCWQLIVCFQGNIAFLKKQVFSAHTRTFEKNLTVHYQSQSRIWLIYKFMSVISDLVISNVEAYKTRWLQSNSERKTCTESSIPPLWNHVFFIKIRLRFLCLNGLAKYATNNNTPGKCNRSRKISRKKANFLQQFNRSRKWMQRVHTKNDMVKCENQFLTWFGRNGRF